MDASAAAALAVLAGGAGATVATAWARLRAPAATPSRRERLTSTWRLSELGTPIVVARDVDVEAPKGARIVASGQVAAQAFADAQVRQVPAVTAEYALSDDGRRGLLFLGGLRPGAQAMPIDDAQLVARLAAEASSLWDRGEPYVERRGLADAAARAGVAVETQGTVLDVLPYQGAFLMRLEDAGQVLGVRVEREPSELKGQRVLVRGQMAKDKGGYPVLVASDLRRLE